MTAQGGFSLMEVNMAVFVVAIGILSMVALFPLGLRESTQGRADLRQSMFADFVLNQAVAYASQTNITWSEWVKVPLVDQFKNKLNNNVPSFIDNDLRRTVRDFYPQMKRDIHYKIACCRVPGASDKIMGIMVQSTDLVDSITKFDQITNNPIYYAEVMFQGDPKN